jgi:hypothetical protein
VRSLLTVGVATCFWIIFDSIAMVAEEFTYGYFYTLRSIMLVLDSFFFLWFMLSLCESPLLKSRLVNRLIFLLPAADVVLLLTNPLHHLVFKSHGFPPPDYGPLFVLYSAIAYAAVALALVYIFRFLITARPPAWVAVLAVVFSLLPVIVNVLFTLHLIEMSQDIASTAFLALFIVFSIHAFRSRLINFKAIALSEIFEVFQDPIIFVEKDFVIADSNMIMGEYFPDFTINPGKTTLAELADYLNRRSISKMPEYLFDFFYHDGPSLAHKAGVLGEFTVPAENEGLSAGSETRTFTVNLLRVYRFRRLYGYSITFSDVSSYRSMINEMTKLKEMAESASGRKIWKNCSRITIRRIPGATVI